MKRKICGACKLSKDISSYNKKEREADKLQPLCKECGKLRSKQYYATNKEKHKRVINDRRVNNKKILKQIIITYKNKPCADCNEEHEPFALDFDHRDPKTKSYTISQMVSLNCSAETLLSEINKCDVVCATCHRYRTFGVKRVGRAGLEPATKSLSSDVRG